MLQRVVSLGLSLLLSNWIQIVALVTHHCQTATHHQAATTAAESTSAVGPTHPQKVGSDCCPHPTEKAAVSRASGVDEMTCRCHSMDCCELHRSVPAGTIPARQGEATCLHNLRFAVDQLRLPSTNDAYSSRSKLSYNRISSTQTTSLRL